MKNRIVRQVKGFGLAALLFASSAGNCGNLLQIKAAEVENQPLTLVQKAEWSDRENFSGTITLELSGLLAYKEKENAAGEAGISEMVWDDEMAADGMTAEGETVTGEALGEEESLMSGGEQTVDGECAAGGETAADSEMITAGAAEDVVIAGEDITGGERTQEGSDGEEIAEEIAEEIVEEIGGEAAREPESFTDGTVLTDSKICLVDYVSEYFELDNNLVSKEYSTEVLTVMNEQGLETTITKVSKTIPVSEITEDTVKMTVPVSLRPQYRISEKAMSYPVSQDEPLQKDTAGTGAFAEKITEETREVLIQAKSPELELEAAKADFTLNLRMKTAEPKAGQPVFYEVELINTGMLPFTNLYLSSVTSQEGTAGEWEAAEGLEIKDGRACLQTLAREESRTFQVRVPLTEDSSGNLRHTVSAETAYPGKEGESMRQEVGIDTTVAALQADFTVEKTADRTEASPGDTITYQICIRNTGERTLHSVLSTERFINAGLQAQFVEKDGVILNGSRTQALISQIAPGEAFALEARVTLSQNMAGQELINQVHVTAKETGSKTVESQANVTVLTPAFTPTPTIMITGQAYYQSGNGTKSSGMAYGTSTQPKTGDDSAAGFFVILLVCCGLSVPGILWRWKGKSKH